MTFQPKSVNGVPVDMSPIEGKLRYLGDKAAAPLELVARAANRVTLIKIETEDSGLRGIEAGFGYRLTWEYDGLGFVTTDLEWGFDPEISTFTFCMVQYGGGPLTICIFAPVQLRRTTMSGEEPVVLIGVRSADQVGAGPTATCLPSPHAVLSVDPGANVEDVRNASADSTHLSMWMLVRARQEAEFRSAISDDFVVGNIIDPVYSAPLHSRCSESHSIRANLDIRLDIEMTSLIMGNAMRAITMSFVGAAVSRSFYTENIHRVTSAAANAHMMLGAITAALGTLFYADGSRRRGGRVHGASPGDLRRQSGPGDVLVIKRATVGIDDIMGIIGLFVGHRQEAARLAT